MGLIQKVESLKKKHLTVSKGLLNKCLSTQKPESIQSQPAAKAAVTDRKPLQSAPLVQPSLLETRPDNPGKNQPNTLPFKALVENVQERVTALTGGIESPAYLFRLIYESFGFKRGAIFLMDDYEQGYSPHATLNWLKRPTDKIMIPRADCWRLLGTTLPELSITLQEGSGKAGENGPDKQIISEINVNPLITLALQDRYSLQPYQALFKGSTMFGESVTASDSPEPVDTRGELMIKPFFIEHTLIGFLIISGIERPHIELFDKVFTPLTINIIKNRLAAMRVTHGHMPAAIPVNMHSDLLKKEQERGRTIKISYDLLLTTILAENNLLYPLRVKQDILLILGNFLSTLGRVYKAPQENVLYLKLYHKEDLDEVLLIHQSHFALHTFFKVTKSMLLIQTNNFIPSEQSALIFG